MTFAALADATRRAVLGPQRLDAGRLGCETYRRMLSAVVIGRRLFDLTDGWDGRPAAGDHVFVVTHQAPADWPHRDTAPFTFVTDGWRARVAKRGSSPASATSR